MLIYEVSMVSGGIMKKVFNILLIFIVSFILF